MEFILKKILLVGVLLFGAISTASASMLPSMQKSGAYDACMKAVNDQWKTEQQRFEKMANFKSGLKQLEKAGFEQTSSCIEAFSQYGAKGSFNIPGVSDVLNTVKDELDNAIAAQCEGVINNLDNTLADLSKQVNFKELNNKFGIKTKFKIGR